MTRGSLGFCQLFVGVLFVDDGTPSVDFWIELPRTDRAHPVESFGNLSCFWIDTGVLEDLTVIYLVLGVFLGFEGKIVVRNHVFHNDTNRPHYVAMGNNNGAFVGNVTIESGNDTDACTDKDIRKRLSSRSGKVVGV